MKVKPKIKNEKERRYAIDVEIRDESEDEMILAGYALKFNTEALIGSKDYGYIETIDPLALNNTDMRKVPLKYNHEGSYLAMASTKNGSLKLEVDTIGLRFEAKLINTQSNRDAYAMVKSGLLSECSFAFTAPLDGGSEWSNFDDNIPLRKIIKIDKLYDIALVDVPAYDNTEVYARSLETLEDVLKTVETEKREQEAIISRINIKIKLNMEE